MDSKRILRALSEIIPHFFVPMVLHFVTDGTDDDPVGEEEEDAAETKMNTISKWNQPLNIIPDHQLEQFKINYKSWKVALWQSESRSTNDRFEILLSLLINQGWCAP